MPNNNEPLAGDILRGTKAIAAELGLEGPKGVRAAFHKLENGLIPGRKVGGEWFSTKSQLHTFFNTAVAPPARPKKETKPKTKKLKLRPRVRGQVDLYGDEE
jgi:hypothetical protein